jgi:(1->4)-alpha-D-glucan 1-alpha-D-glucosylmutase
VSAEDRATIARTINATRARWVGTDTEVFDFLQDALTLDLVASGRSGYSSARVTRFALKVQQFTGPMMAKSLEDTAFYRHVRLLALNEVGAHPDAAGLSIEDFHGQMKARVTASPHGMTATATHDTKRGEDARARVLAISELAGEWVETVRCWHSLNDRLVARLHSVRAPSRLHETMLYQTLVGAWPIEGRGAGFADRMKAYALKAAREGKVETSWTNPNEAYEKALTAFVGAILDPGQSGEFIDSFEQFAQRAALLGALNSLVQLALKASMPGVPDFYQGTEFWDLPLVDPDNRRSVDFSERAAALGALAQSPDWSALVSSWRDGRIKLALMHRLLAWRRERRLLFELGDYRPLAVSGRDRDHVIAFARTSRRDAAIIVAGRHFAALTEGGRRWPRAADWDATLHLDGFANPRDRLHSGRVIGGHRIEVASLFETLPVALLDASHGTPGPLRR